VLETPIIAIAQDPYGRSIYASCGLDWFRAVPHFPSSAEEAAVLYEHSLGPKLHLEEMQALHNGAVELVRV